MLGLLGCGVSFVNKVLHAVVLSHLVEETGLGLLNQRHPFVLQRITSQETKVLIDLSSDPLIELVILAMHKYSFNNIVPIVISN